VPVLQVPCLKQPPKKFQEAVVVELFAEDPQQDRVIDVLEYICRMTELE
jgi:hypothetical protein